MLVVITSTALGASGNFKTSDYIPEKFTDFQWKLNGSAKLSSSDDNSTTDEADPAPGVAYDMTERVSDSDSKNASLGSSMYYRYETVQRFLKTGCSLSLRYGRSSSQRSLSSSTPMKVEKVETDYSYSSFNGEFSSGVEAGQYIIRDFFVSTGVDLHYGYGETPNYRNDTYDYYRYLSGDYYRERETVGYWERKSDDRTIDIKFEITPGWGRLYEGRYASTALYMIEELRNEGLLNGNVSREHMLALCDIIYQYRLKHCVDMRLHRIEALNAVLSFLNDKGYTPEMGPYGAIC
ncbi:MAG: hypothetical protein DRP47_03255 [Candidatus Zixiibacteriota bacterium]|nr:MAG: hypothetical protein DRP47_03255 [candidate division Zixibacteria bacterium]